MQTPTDNRLTGRLARTAPARSLVPWNNQCVTPGSAKAKLERLG
jgi:hypothetical protein